MFRLMIDQKSSFMIYQSEHVSSEFWVKQFKVHFSENVKL